MNTRPMLQSLLSFPSVVRTAVKATENPWKRQDFQLLMLQSQYLENKLYFCSVTAPQ